MSTSPEADTLEEEGIRQEVQAGSQLKAAEEEGGHASRVETIDKRWIFVGVPAVVLGLLLVSLIKAPQGDDPPAPPPAPPAASVPESADPPYAVGAPPFGPARGGDTLAGAPLVPPPSSAVVGQGDYRTVPSGDPSSAGAQAMDSSSAGAPQVADPRREAFKEALDAPPVPDGNTSIAAQGTPLPDTSPELIGPDSAGSSGEFANPGGEAGRSAPRRALPEGVVVPALTVVPAALVTTVDSENPGDIIAQVSRDVVDASGRVVAIPRGSLLYGRQSDQVAVGQQRLAVGWTMLQLPDGSLLELPGLPMLDESGATGVRGRVSSQAARTLGNVLLVSTLTAAIGASQPVAREGERPTLAQAGSAAVAQELARLGTEMLRRDFAARPRIRLVRGQPIRVILRDHLVVSAR